MWLYLIFAVSNAMMPSPSDRESWRLVLIYLAVVAGVLVVFGWLPACPSLVRTLADGLHTLTYAFGLTLLIDVVFAVLLALIELCWASSAGARWCTICNQFDFRGLRRPRKSGWRCVTFSRPPRSPKTSEVEFECSTMKVIGTAGHVDHGKSTLVLALTGIDPDRLAEEKAREMTIDLGFAWLTLPDGETVGVIDVPGHIDFIKNMLAGVGGIDAALFVIAADEGVMPQTREHLAILDLLQVSAGVVALTKIDMVQNDPDWLELVQADVAEALEGTSLAGAPIVPVSARTGQGLDASRPPSPACSARCRSGATPASRACPSTAPSAWPASAPSSPAR